jgi:hypothetical protein
MNTDSVPQGEGKPRSPWPWLLVGGCLVVILIGLLARRAAPPADGPSTVEQALAPAPSTDGAAAARGLSWFRRPRRAPGLSAEQVVTDKFGQFARGRREIVHAMARHFNVEVPAEVKRFFDAAEAGRWDDLKAIYSEMSERQKGGQGPPKLHTLWPAISETVGVAEQVHQWPAQQLLDYGQAVLDSLRPGMVYVGGSDPGRFIPTLLNATSAGERHVVLTQNAFADGTYLDYVRFLYADRLATLTADDSQRGFQDYLADAQRRLLHDQQFPHEPKQVRPDEDIRITDNRVQVSGQVAVMAINERLLQALMDKNPDVSFALEESFPFKSMLAEAAPLGPVMELRARHPQNTLTAERAAQTVEQWRATAQTLLADPQFTESPEARNAYAKMAAAHGGLLLERGYQAEAAEALRLATELGPTAPDAVFRYVNLLVAQGRISEAAPVVETAAQLDPGNRQFRSLLEQLQTMQKNAPAK